MERKQYISHEAIKLGVANYAEAMKFRKFAPAFWDGILDSILEAQEELTEKKKDSK